MADGDAPPGQRVDATPPPATVLNGKYRIERVIGQGAFGRVYLAFDPLLRRNVAIKELLAARGTVDATTYERYLERFQREARAAGGLEHPNIVTVYELAVADDGTHYLVMQYVDGTDLRELLRTVGSLPVERAVAIAIGVARALETAHEQEIVHRDVKPANVMLTSRGVAKLTDFGIAQVGNESHRTQMQIGHPGTPIYMSPEQAASAEYLDDRSDLYSLGLVLFEMLTGEQYVRNRRSLGEARPGVSLPPQLVRIVDRLLERDPDARYQRAADLLADLERLSLMSAPALTGAEQFPAPSNDAAVTVVPNTAGRTTADEGISGVPAAYGGAPSDAPAGSPIAAPPPPAYPVQSAPPMRQRRRGLLLGLAALLALVIVVGGIGAWALTRGSAPPTATAAVPALPTIPPGAGAIMADLSRWPVGDLTNERRYYDRSASEYHIATTAPHTLPFTTSPDIQTGADFIIETDVRRVSGFDTDEYGLVFRSQPRAAGDTLTTQYVFRINGRSQYSLTLMNADGTAITVQPLTTSPAIKPGIMTNHLTVLCKGETVTVAANGTTLGSWRATLVKPGKIGVSVASGSTSTNTDAAFKNVRYTPL